MRGDMTDYYLITKDELLKAATDNGSIPKEKALTVVEVLTRPYKERTGIQVLGRGVSSVAGGAVDLLGGLAKELTKEDPPKGKKPKGV
jgi:hypothetical protein